MKLKRASHETSKQQGTSREFLRAARKNRFAALGTTNLGIEAPMLTGSVLLARLVGLLDKAERFRMVVVERREESLGTLGVLKICVFGLGALLCAERGILKRILRCRIGGNVLVCTTLIGW